MDRSTIDLDAVTIASPCTVPWDSMEGDEGKRFCGQCRLHVHDVSQLTRREADALIESAGGRCCLRLWRRPDGRVITKDCGRVRLAIARRLAILRTAAAGLFAALGLVGCSDGPARRSIVTTGAMVSWPPPKPPSPGAGPAPLMGSPMPTSAVPAAPAK